MSEHARSKSAVWDFTNKTVAITGATGGIARAVLAAIAPIEGVRLLLHAREKAAVEALAGDLEKQGAETETLVDDLAEHAVEIGQAFAALGDIDVLINNAGVYTPGGILSVSPQEMRKTFEINAMAVLAAVQTVIPGMVERGYGRVVTISSGSGSFGEGQDPAHAAYAVSKAAANAMTFLAARDARGDVKVNAMCPGWVRTKMGGASAPRSPEEGADTALWLAALPADGPNGGFFRDRKPIPW